MLTAVLLIALAQPQLPAPLEAPALLPSPTDGGVELELELAEDDAEPTEELEAMRAEEAAALTAGPAHDAALRLTLSRLTFGSAMRDRLETALDAADGTGADLPPFLAPVTDVTTFDVSLVKDRFDIPVEMQPLVVRYIQFFQGSGRKWFRRWVSRSHRYIPLMQPLLEAHGLPRDTVYLAMIESGFNTQARSWAKAVGPWQFIPGTAKWFELKEDFWIDERRDPVKSTHAAARYLSLLHSQLGHWYLAWAGYNTGGGRVRKLVDKYGTTDFWELSEKKGLAKETKHYVPKLIACALVARHPEAFGFSPDEFTPLPPMRWDEVPLTEAVDLEALAQAAGVPVEDVQELNPELKRWCTPPASDAAPYLLRIPEGTKQTFLANFAQFAPAEKLSLKVHQVQKGDTLSRIAQRYRSFPEAIMRMNGLDSPKALKLGVDLVVPVPSATALKSGRSDLALERQVTRARRSGLRAGRPQDEVPAGTATAAVGGSISVAVVGGKSKVTYGVARGDTLWAIARRFDVHVSDVREWNPSLGGSRGLKVGQALTVWPGPGAKLPASGGAARGGAK